MSRHMNHELVTRDYEPTTYRHHNLLHTQLGANLASFGGCIRSDL
jgi:hypothetical protein